MFQFDGSGDYIVSTGVPTASGSGNFTHTVSMWFKLDSIGGQSRVLWGMVGEDDGTDGSPSAYAAPHSVVTTSGNITWAMWGNDVHNQTTIVANKWYHCVWTYSGGTTGRKMFLDGVEQSFNAAQTAALNMPNATSRLTIGIYPHNLTSNPLDGQVSNFKLWTGVALTADEVAMEYALGRTGKALNITDTAVCIGGRAPRAQLDVRGSITATGTIQFNNPRFFAYSWSGTTSVGAGAPIVYNLTAYNVGSCYSTGDGYFKAPVNGFYQFTSSIYSFTALEYSWKLIPIAGATTNNNMHVMRSDSYGDDILFHSIEANRVCTGSIQVYLTAGEKFGLGTRSGSGSVYRAHGYFSGHLISMV